MKTKYVNDPSFGNSLDERIIKNMKQQSLNTKIIAEEVSYEVDDMGGLKKSWKAVSSHWGRIFTVQNKSKFMKSKLHFISKHNVVMTRKSAQKFLGKINSIRLAVKSQNRILQITGVNLSNDKYTIIKTSELM